MEKVLLLFLKEIVFKSLVLASIKIAGITSPLHNTNTSKKSLHRSHQTNHHRRFLYLSGGTIIWRLVVRRILHSSPPPPPADCIGTDVLLEVSHPCFQGPPPVPVPVPAAAAKVEEGEPGISPERPIPASLPLPCAPPSVTD